MDWLVLQADIRARKLRCITATPHDAGNVSPYSLFLINFKLIERFTGSEALFVVVMVVIALMKESTFLLSRKKKDDG